MDAKELITAETIAVNQFLVLAETTTDEATILTCVDFGFSLSLIQVNAADLDLYSVHCEADSSSLGNSGSGDLQCCKAAGASGQGGIGFSFLIEGYSR